MNYKSLDQEWDATCIEMSKYAPQIGDRVLCAAPEVYAGEVVEVSSGYGRRTPPSRFYKVRLEDGSYDEFHEDNVLKRKEPEADETIEDKVIRSFEADYWWHKVTYELRQTPTGKTYYLGINAHEAADALSKKAVEIFMEAQRLAGLEPKREGGFTGGSFLPIGTSLSN